ncbi:MAG: hypothetical protein NTU48_06155 [Legionellales bacterium]|nr:hypothetical protein [Legionellales bacterium]
MTPTSSDYFSYGYQYFAQQKKLIDDIVQCDNLDRFKGFMTVNHFTPNTYISGKPLLLLAGCNHIIPSALTYYLLKNGANPHAKAHSSLHDAYEGTALHALLANELIKKAKFFVKIASKFGRGVDSRIQDVEGKTILHMGALLRDAGFIELCL